MKLLVKFGDKVLFGIIVLWVLVSLFSVIQMLLEEPEVSDKIASAIEKAKTISPPPKVEDLEVDVVEKVEEDLGWPLGELEQKRPSLRFRRDIINPSELQDEYVKLLEEHTHTFFGKGDGSGDKHCVFPGCPEEEKAPPVYLGAPSEFKVDEVTVMTISLSWKGPVDFKDAKLKHCILQRGQKNEAGDIQWSDVLDEEGELRIILPTYGEDEGVVASAGDGEAASGFLLPTVVEEKEEDKEENDAKEKVAHFRFLDFNLDPGTEYIYRTKAIGVSVRDGGEAVEGIVWTKPLVAGTEEDQGMGFIRLIPGIRDREGNLKTRADGSYVSPDKAYVRVTKLFDPPWSPQRFFIHYEHRNIIPKDEKENRIGEEVRRFKVKTEDGNNVYIDRRKENFLYVNESRTADDVKAMVEREKGNWKIYTILQDFSTPWVAVSIEEKIVEEKDVVTRYDNQGRALTVSNTGKKYRYFLNIENSDSKEKRRLELERDMSKLTSRILNY